MYDANFDESWQGDKQRRSTGKQFKRLLFDVGLNQTTAARYMGISDRGVRRMAAGKSKVPVSALLLFNLMWKHKEAPMVPPKKKRRR